jgi:type VI secretion system ImpA family protein
MTPAPALAAFHFDLQRVLQPISPESPTGESLRYDGLYDRIRLWRQEDDPVLQQGVWKTALKKADWPAVERACIQALEEKTKDIQIGSWLAEAWVHLYGFAGLREGFRLLTALCERFWDGLHPQIEDGDLEYRLSPMVWLNERLPTYLKLILITSPQSEDVKPYCWADWELACRPRRPDEPEPKDDSRITQAKFQQSAMMTPTAFLRGTLHQVKVVLDEASRLESVLNRFCGREAPSLRQFAITLEPMIGLLDGILSQRPEPENEPVREGHTMFESDDLQSAQPAVPAVPMSHSGPIRSRAEAYMRLEEVAEYLARTEPHSPTPYLIKRAISWGGMRLEDLLPELVRNRGELDEIYDLLRISKGSI